MYLRRRYGLRRRKILSDDVCDKKETAMPLDNPYRNAKDIDFLYGAYLLKEGHPVLQDYLKREARDLPGIIRKAVCDF